VTGLPSETASDRGIGIADAAGVSGAIIAALCCAGTPIIVGALGAVGLSFLRRDAVLWPIMLVSLAVALWGFWQGWRLHRNLWPLITGATGALSLASGVIVVHGPPAMTMIYGGAVLLVLATCWNILARRARNTASGGTTWAP
jgi:mercuric ion transport protein